jgi:phospholipid/cholesterol/gamma-HCH transport system substrate-binding protein
MTEREPGVSRWRHFRNSLSRQSRGRSKDTIAIAIIVAVGTVMTLWIFTQQKASLPSWVPLVGEEFAHVTGEFTTAQAVTPGQGQAVDIAGIQVGKITSVDLEDGHAVVGMDIEPKYMELIHPDATLLLRPKTGLNDMLIEVDPGAAPGHIEDGYNFPLSRTEPNVNLDAFLATLDADTRQYIQLLVAGGAQGIGDQSRELSGALRRLQPFSHYIADLNRAVARRRVALARVIHNFGLLTTELGRHDRDIERFVSSSKSALGNFANQQQAIQETLIELPSTLAVAESTFASADRFAKTAGPALLDLIPQAQALGPALRANARFFEETTEPIATQVRPFTRQIRPTLTHTKQGAADLERSVRGFGNALGGFNSFLNTLAYKPKDSRQSFLFYLPWLNHNINATFNLEDPAGPISRSLLMISCNGAYLGKGAAAARSYLLAVLRGANVPRQSELPPIPPDRSFKSSGCGPGTE